MWDYDDEDQITAPGPYYLAAVVGGAVMLLLAVLA